MLIGSRLLKLKLGSGHRDLQVRLFVPEKGESDWSCRYEIDWPEGLRESAAYGIDAIQALHLALQKIGVDLYASDHHKTGTLMWEGTGGGYGFPVPKNLRDMLVGDDQRFDG